MRRGKWNDADVLRRSGRERVIPARELVALGVDERTVYRRCLPGGPWQRLLPGMILLHNLNPTDDQRVAGALLYAGPDALITGVNACRRHGLRPAELPRTDDVHVLVPHGHKVKSCEYVTVERTHRLPAPTTRNRVPLAPLVRATLDAARRIRTVEPVAKLLIEAIQRGHSSASSLSAELESGSTRGTAIPRRLLAEIHGLRSVAELHGRRVTERVRVPPTHWNVDIRSASGEFIGRPDAWWDDVGMASEIDSYDWHFTAGGYARTLDRNTRYAAFGIPVVQILPSRLLKDPGRVIADLEAAYEAAAGRPRPDVYVVSPDERCA